MHLYLTVGLLGLMVGCVKDKDVPSDDTNVESDTETAPNTDTDTAPDTDTALDAEPIICGGEMDVPAAVTDMPSTIFVSVDGDDGEGDGSRDLPYASLTAAIASSLESGKKLIAIGAGEFATQAEISDEDLTGLSIVGCGANQTFLNDPDADEPSWQLLIRDTVVVGVADLSFVGGSQTLKIMDDAEVLVENVNVDSPTGTGIFVYGPARVTLRDVWVSAPQVSDLDEYQVAYGISARGSSETDIVFISMEGGGITDATVAGLIAQAADVVLSDVTVSGTTADPNTGAFGRGVQVQGYSTLAVSGGSFMNNVDAGIFSVASISVSLSDNASVTGTSAGTIPDSADSSGDGVVIIRGEDSADFYSYGLEIDGLTVDGNARAGVVVEDVAYTVGGVTGSNTGVPGYETYNVLAQGDAVDVGSTDAVGLLTAPLPLNLNTPGFTP